MSAIRDRIFAGVPAYLDQNPEASPALSITYAGACTATVGRHRLTLTPAAAAPVSFDLLGYTFASLRAALNLVAGFDVQLLDPDVAAIGASSLTEGTTNLALDNRLTRFTSVLWAVVMPIVWSLEDTLDNLKAGLGETTLKTADGQWVELWGQDYYGGLRRLVAEADRPYADRIIREVTRWRLNNKALKVIVKEDLGLTAEVTNLHEQAWVIGGPFGRFAWRKYSRTTFEVLVDGVSSDLALTIERNRAAGTLPFYRYRDIRALRSVVVHAHHHTVSTFPAIGSPGVWGVGGPFDSLMISHDRVYNTTVITRANEFAFSAGAAGDFLLGAAVLGVALLGGGASDITPDTVTVGESTTVIGPF